MRFVEFFGERKGPVVSFEVYPPRTAKAAGNLDAALGRLVRLGPHFMTVTYGAFGSTRDQTVEIAAHIRRTYGLEAATHVTCVGSSRDDLDVLFHRIRGEGIENVIALRGDPPQGEERFVAVDGGFSHANELVAHLRDHHDFGIAVAGYPEKHIEAPDMDTDLGHLRRKVDAGADVVITQLFFDNADFFAFRERTEALGISVPIVPGILPIQSSTQVRKITSMCGAKIPERLAVDLDQAGDDATAVRELGITWCIEQCRELLESGAPGIHFYVLNRAEHMERIVTALREEGALGPAPR